MNSKEYYEFISKFEERHTTDDCYTPPAIYDVVADWVAKEYNLNPDNFVRPFVPNGDYQAFEYAPDAVVVDNPPFSILSKIIDFYLEKGIKFFLFAPNKTVLGLLAKNRKVTAICASANVIYDNGANVKTAFVTNLEDDIAARSCPELYFAIKEAQKNTKPKQNKYPGEVVIFSKIDRLSETGVHFEIKHKDCAFIRRLDEQKENGKQIFGGGLLLSKNAVHSYRQAKECSESNSRAAKKAAAEKAAAEKAATTVWKLSDREREIIAGLGG